MPYLKQVDGEVVEWGLNFETLRFTYRQTSFPTSVPRGWTFEADGYGELGTRWIYYTDIVDASAESTFKTETKPILGEDGFFYSTIINPVALGKTVFSFGNSVIFEGDRIDIQTIPVNLSAPLLTETTFHISVSDGKTYPNHSIYKDTWIEELTGSITVAAGETSFEVPILVKGNVFYNANPRMFDIKIWSDDGSLVSPTGNILRNPKFSLLENDLPSGTLKLSGEEIVTYETNWNVIRSRYPNTSFGSDMVNGTFYGVISMESIDSGVSYANYARWTPPNAPDGYSWVLDVPIKVSTEGLNTLNYNWGTPYSVLYQDQTFFYKQNWVLNENNTAINLIEEVGFGLSPNLDGTADSDAIIAAGTDNNINAGNSSDLVLAGWGNDTVEGGTGNDALFGEAGHDWVSGGNGDDFISGGGGSDHLSGGEGDDELQGGAGSDTLDGGEGEDCADYSDRMIGIFASLIEAIARGRSDQEALWTDELLRIENLCGTLGDDQLQGDIATNKIGGNAGADTLKGGAGFDWFDPEDAPAGLVVDLSQDRILNDGYGHVDVIRGIEGVIGTQFGDSIIGDARANSFWGNGGNDTIQGGLGEDSVFFGDLRSSYKVDFLGGGNVRVQDLRVNSPDGTDELSQVERLVFTDTTLAVAGANPGHAIVDQGAGASPRAEDSVSGVVYHWKKHSLISEAQLTAMPPVSSLGDSNTSLLFEFKNASSNPQGKFTAELWVKPSLPTGSIDLTLKYDQALSLKFVEAQSLPSGWTLLDEGEDGRWTLAAMGLNELNGAVRLGDIEWSNPGTGLETVVVTVIDAATESETQNPYQTTLSTGGQTGGGQPNLPSEVASAADGSFTIGGFIKGSVNGLSIAKPIEITEAGSVITSADALAALKIAVGRSPNADNSAATPYQLISADVNGSGSVTSADALAILKMAVKRSDAPAREWIFVDEMKDFWNEATNTFTTTRTSVPTPANLAITVDPAIRGEVNLVGMLKGDVNGSWSAPAGSETLPLSYFQALAAANSSVMNIAQFG